MNRVKHVTAAGKHYGYSFHCPGCDEAHVIPTVPHPNGWTFNSDESAPTFSPSILVHSRKVWSGASVIDTPRCHSFVTNGRIQFLSDSTHPLAGQTVDLPEIGTRA